jgi:deoxyribonuclease-4
MAARRAAAAGMQALQIFSAKPQFYNDKISVKPERATRFREALAETGIGGSRCLVHAAYVLNTASPEADKYERAAGGLAKELERTTQLGAFGFCFHPGSAGTSDPASAVARVGDAITRALESVDGTTRVLIENTAGAGRTMGRTPEEIAGMLQRVPAALRGRAGYGLDTCHLFASGLDLHTSPASASALIDRFCDIIGEPPSFLHLNDSANPFGSNRDRHVLIGEGQIGIEPFRWLLADVRTQGIPAILETPHDVLEVSEDDPTPDPSEVRMMQLLVSLSGG